MNEEHKHLIKLNWQERCKAVSRYHAGRCKDNPSHTITDTASELNRSAGRISEDLALASWMKTHPRVEKFKNPAQALDYIRSKKKEMKVLDA
jgi:hypothetical protein